MGIGHLNAVRNTGIILFCVSLLMNYLSLTLKFKKKEMIKRRGGNTEDKNKNSFAMVIYISPREVMFSGLCMRPQ
jgi:hypothetical protein